MLKALKWFLYGLLVLVGAFTLATFFVPKSYALSRSLEVAAPPALVFSQVVDLEAWQQWNPWNAADPDITIEYGATRVGVGAEYRWESAVLGGGRMQVTAVEFPGRVEYLLEFTGYESQPSTSAFVIEAGADAGRSVVTWTLEGSVGDAFYGRWSTLLMERFVGPSYEEGLRKLAARCEQMAALADFTQE